MITVRFAKTTDVPTIVTLTKAMADYHHALDPIYYRHSKDYQDVEGNAASWLNDKDTAIILAEENEIPIGYLVAEIEKPGDYIAPNIKKIGVIQGIFIEGPYRKKGVGKALVAKAMEWFDKKQTKHIELSVDARNSEARSVWSALGFFDYKIRMRLDRK